MKKKILTFIFSLAFLLTLTSTEGFAALPQNTIPTISSEIIYQDDDFTVESNFIPSNYSSSMRLYSTSNQKTVSKKITIKNSSGTTLATYTISGTFSYNGSSATCTNVSYSSSIKKSKWSFISRSASKSGNKAIGSYKLKKSSTGKTYTGSVTITCNKNGTIS